MIGNYWYPEYGGGLEQYFYGLVNQLAQDKHEVDFFTLGTPDPTYYGAKGQSLGPKDAALLQRMGGSLSALRKLQTNHYDVVNVHFALNALPALLYIAQTTPIIMHFHGPWASESTAEGKSPINTRIKKAIESLVFKRSHQFITASSNFSKILTNDYRISAERIVSIPLAIDTKIFSPTERQAARAELGWHPSKFTLFTARRLVRRVGISELLRAFSTLPETAQLKIAGRGPLAGQFQSEIQDLKLQNVELLGYIDESRLRFAYSAADLVVLPSQELEGFGLTFAEALSCGTPVLVTPVGGMPEYVSKLQSDLVCLDQSADEISRSIAYFIKNPEYLPSREQCRTFALTNFSWMANLQQVNAVFQRHALAKD